MQFVFMLEERRPLGRVNQMKYLVLANPRVFNEYPLQMDTNGPWDFKP